MHLFYGYALCNLAVRLDRFWANEEIYYNYKTTIGTIVDDHGNLVVSDYAKANMFNTYYASVGTVDNGDVPDISSTNPSMCIVPWLR